MASIFMKLALGIRADDGLQAIGLHVPVATQDFSRGKVNISDSDVSFRTQLWTHCLIAHGRVCSLKGIAGECLEDFCSVMGCVHPSVEISSKTDTLHYDNPCPEPLHLSQTWSMI